MRTEIGRDDTENQTFYSIVLVYFPDFLRKLIKEHKTIFPCLWFSLLKKQKSFASVGFCVSFVWNVHIWHDDWPL